MREVERRGSPEAVDIADLVRDLDPRLPGDFLQDERHREERRQVGRSDRLAGARVQDRGRRPRQVRHDVVPVSRDLALVEQDLGRRVRSGHQGAFPNGRCDRLYPPYLMASVAWIRTDCGMVSPSSWAVFRLITKSNVVGRSTGRSAGLAPLRILSTWEAARRYISGSLAP